MQISNQVAGQHDLGWGSSTPVYTQTSSPSGLQLQMRQVQHWLSVPEFTGSVRMYVYTRFKMYQHKQ